MLLSTTINTSFFNDTATTEIYTRTDTLSLHDALPISRQASARPRCPTSCGGPRGACSRSEEHTSELQSPFLISYAVFCLKKKNGARRHRARTGRRGRRGRCERRALADRLRDFFFNDTAATEIYTRKDTLSLHDALPI